MLENLQPERVMYYFEEISKIPRSSGKEKGISDYLVYFAKEHNLEYIQDGAMNVIIKKKGTGNKTVILQAHMDMVCVKNDSVEHNFEKDPISLVIDGDFVKASGTTLGADNGIGVAYCLAVLESDIVHPNIECIFTTDEEEGMTGAYSIDFGKLEGDMLINLDSEEEGIITVGCAGGARVNISVACNYENIEDKIGYIISIDGLPGGHSGVDINKRIPNAIKELSKILRTLEDNKLDFRIVSIKGGSKTNAIPRDASAIICIKKEDVQKLKSITNVQEVRVDKMLTQEESKNIIKFLFEVHDGVYTMSKDVEGLVESSSNIGILEQNEESIEIKLLPRSSNSEKLDEIIEKISQAANNMNNVSLTVDSRYPSWDFAKESKLRDVAIRVYEKIYGVEPKINIIHAGLECAVFKEKRRTLDLISIGPNIKGAHTPEERLSIDSTKRIWDYLKDILEELSN